MPSFFQELHRRSLFRIAAGYVVVAWVLIQAASIILPTFSAPAWVLQVFVSFVALGFPLALVLGWAYGDPPEGAEASEVRLTRGGMITDGVLVVAVALLIGITAYGLVSNPRVVEVERTAASEQASIAVLAFRDLSGDGSQIHFAEGISEEILNRLAQVDDLRVAARTSSFAYSGDEYTAVQIAEALGVAYVLEGSVRIFGDNMRITAQLIDAQHDRHLWSENFDRPMRDIFAIQDDVANEVLHAFNEETGTSFAEVASDDQGTTSVEAYSAYLLGRHNMQQREAEALRRAASAYQQAIEIDPEFADAHAALGRTYFLNYGAFEEEEVAQDMRDHLYEAINLDPDNAVAIATLSLILGMDENRPVEAGILARRALELAPDDIEIKMSYVNSLMGAGRFRDAYVVLQEILEEDPAFPPARTNLGFVYQNLGHYERVIPPMLTAIAEEDPEDPALGWRLYVAMLAHRIGDMDLYRRMEAEVAELAAGNEIATLGFELWQAGMQALAEGDPAALNQMIAEGAVERLVEEAAFFDAGDAVRLYATAGDNDRAFQYLERAFSEDNYGFVDDRLDPFPAPDTFYQDPRYLEIIESDPRARAFHQLLEGARAQGQWEPLTPEELGDLTN